MNLESAVRYTTNRLTITRQPSLASQVLKRPDGSPRKCVIDVVLNLNGLCIANGHILGEFNRSSQHFNIGGVDDDRETEIGAVYGANCPRQDGRLSGSVTLCRCWQGIGVDLSSEEAGIEAFLCETRRNSATRNGDFSYRAITTQRHADRVDRDVMDQTMWF